MNELIALWLPVLVAGIFVFAASSLIHMVFQWHNSDYRKVGDEDAVRTVLQATAGSPGLYALPHCSDMKEMGSAHMQEKFREGPVALITIKPRGMPNMGSVLGAWFVLNLIVAAVAAGVALQALGAGTAAIAETACQAACLGGVVTFMSYSVGSISNGIWMGRLWSAVAKDLFDAAIYGAVTGLAFWWLWPAS